jgi:hypothetical protein
MDRNERSSRPITSVISPLLTESDAARYLSMSAAFLRQGRMHGRGPAYVRMGRAVRYALADLDEWLSERRIVPRNRH